MNYSHFVLPCYLILEIVYLKSLALVQALALALAQVRALAQALALALVQVQVLVLALVQVPVLVLAQVQVLVLVLAQVLVRALVEEFDHHNIRPLPLAYTIYELLQLFPS